jgi:methylase of polypeptide subunit release factors
MEATYTLHPEEFNTEFLDSIKAFLKPNATIVVKITEEGEDTTAYLLSTENNKNALLASVAQEQEGKVIRFNSILDVQNFAEGK